MLQNSEEMITGQMPNFSKGMTLDEYMSSMNVNQVDENITEDESYENLY